jgi:hypothetical protein
VDNPAYDLYWLYNWPALAKIVLEDPINEGWIKHVPALRMFEGNVKDNFIIREDFDVIKAYRDIRDRYRWDWEEKEGGPSQSQFY